MLRAAVDTNVFVAGLCSQSKLSPSAAVLEAILSGRYRYLSSDSIFHELKYVLEMVQFEPKHNMSNAEISAFCAKLEVRCEKIIVREKAHFAPVVRDISDAKFIELAIAGDADYLVTNDRRHLLSLKKIGRTKIVTPHKFLLALTRFENE